MPPPILPSKFRDRAQPGQQRRQERRSTRTLVVEIFGAGGGYDNPQLVCPIDPRFGACSPLQAQAEFIYLTATPAVGGWNEWGPGVKPKYFSTVVMACDQAETAISQAQQQFHPGLHHSYNGNEFLVSWNINHSECYGTEQAAEQARQAAYDETKRGGGWSPVWFSFRFTRND